MSKTYDGAIVARRRCFHFYDRLDIPPASARTRRLVSSRMEGRCPQRRRRRRVRWAPGQTITACEIAGEERCEADGCLVRTPLVRTCRQPLLPRRARDATRMLYRSSSLDQQTIRQWFADHRREWLAGEAFRFAVEREGRMIGIVDAQIRLGTAFPMLSLPLREFSFTQANREPGRAFRKGVGGRPLAARGTELTRTDQGDRCKLYILDSWESASEQSEFDHVRGC